MNEEGNKVYCTRSDDSVMVSVICTTYNHEKYIADALESFLMQQTSFRFEVVVFDDASTDHTADIIREYENRYPYVIKPIYQKENLYSKNISKLPYLQNVACGKYVAICEGDDYWTDSCKLQKQFDYMEANPGCTLCIHNAVIVNTSKEIIGDITVSDTDKIILTEDVISGGGAFCATNSIFTRGNLYFNRPAYFDILSLDYILQIYLASSGYTYCFAEVMSAYRKGVENSWTSRMSGFSNRKKMAEHINKVNLTLQSFDKATSYKYHDVIDIMVEKNRFQIMDLTGDIKIFKNKRYRKYLKKLSLKSKFSLLCKVFLGAIENDN